MWQKKTAVFLTSQSLSLIGTALVQYALMWHVALETKSGLVMTLFVICGFLPTFLLAPFAGVWADRYDRKRLIVLSDGLIALITLALAVVFMRGDRSLWLIMAASALRAVGSAIQGPAVGAILPQFVPEEHLTKVNGINGTLQSAITLASPILAGVLVTVWPLHRVFFIDLVTAVVAILILQFFLQVDTHQKALAPQTTTYLEDMKEGLRYIRSHKYLIPFFLCIGFLLLLISPAAFLTPIQVARSFGEEVWRLTAIEVVFSVGMMLGGAWISVWGGFTNRMYTLAFSIVIMAACTLGLGLTGLFWLYLAFMGIFGVALPFFNTPSAVFLQEQVEEDFLGRVFSFNTMLFTSVMPLGMLLFGPLAEVIAIETLLIITGILMLLPALVLIRSRVLVQAGRAHLPVTPDHTSPPQ